MSASIDLKTVILATEVGLKVLDVFLANRVELASDDEVEKRKQLQKLSDSIDTEEGMADFQAILDASRKKDHPPIADDVPLLIPPKEEETA